jgi:hypothetical protein
MLAAALALPGAAWALTGPAAGAAADPGCPPGATVCEREAPRWTAQLVTAGGVIVTGGVLWWLGTVWPRRTPDQPISATRSTYGRRRYPDLPLQDLPPKP